ncbi:MAG TPA: DUF72 domain-containing protein [Desulfobacteraceae bacterium]|nr:DUF72 domain-containing protein [Desulfobacteraceae bacterium]
MYRIGTSGWNYPHWKGRFYPENISRNRWLEFYTKKFDTLELNATFYRIPKPTTFRGWYKRTPEGFIWALKANRVITHIRRLKDCREPLSQFLGLLKEIREKAGPVLFQFPPSLKFDKELFEDFCQLLPPDYRYTIEVRNPSWIDDKAFDIMYKFKIALCIADSAGRYPFHKEITADFVYIRLHGSKKLYASEYTEEELQMWAKDIHEWGKETFVYFDNDFNGYAVKNALRLKEILLDKKDS